MSRWWPERIRIALHADRAALIRLGGRQRHTVVGRTLVPFAGAALDPLQIGGALGDALRQPEWRYGAVEVVFSHVFCKLALIPGGIAVHGRREEDALHRNCIEEANGDLPTSWRIAVADAPAHLTRLACAVDGALLDGLETAVKSSGGKLNSLRPLIVDAYNARRSEIGRRSLWFATIERERCCIARLRSGVWESLRTRRVFTDPETELARLLRQERVRAADEDSAADELLLCAPNHPQLRLAADIAPSHSRKVDRNHRVDVEAADFGMALEGLQ